MEVFRFVRAAQSAHGVGLVGAHVLYKPADGPASAVVAQGLDPLKQLFPLAVHILGQEQAAAGVGIEPQLADQRDHVLQLAALGQIPVFRKIREEAHRVDLSQLAHARLHSRSVKSVQPGGDRAHIGERSGAPAEDIGDRRVFRGSFPVQLSQKRGAQAPGFEFVGSKSREPHTGGQLRAEIIHNASHAFVFDKIIIAPRRTVS